MTAPIGYTCKYIDRQLLYIESAISFLSQALLCNYIEDVKLYIENAMSELSSVDLETLRDQNSQLRSWGEELEDEINSLKIDLHYAEKEIQKLENV